jgi:hypothetical protein
MKQFPNFDELRIKSLLEKERFREVGVWSTKIEIALALIFTSMNFNSTLKLESTIFDLFCFLLQQGERLLNKT